MNRKFGGVVLAAAVALAALVMVGCASQRSDLRALESCGSFLFPAGAELAEYEVRTSFGDETMVAVVEVPVSELNEFKVGSNIDRFSPGVPEYLKDYWRNTKNFPALESGRAEHADEGGVSQTRWVAHSSEGATDIIFIRAAC
ncbi:hypothetical protein ACFWPK_28920 [Nocardia sp. NPDC058519]|uniref:hypothetical protein n=1 Tax=Nocardia sp. NPDC058519 TaxID=3346535 RepID=UPI00365D1D14